MGRGNCCVHGPYEGLYFIDNEYLHVYRSSEASAADGPETRLLRELDYEELTGGRWLYDDLCTEDATQELLDTFADDLMNVFPSFRRVPSGYWISQDRRAILENQLFYVCIEDNQWSLAIELIQKELCDDAAWSTFQARHYRRYLDGMKRCLLRYLPSIGIYNGPWTSRFIKREELAG